MEQKRVSFKVAKAFKEVGYPQYFEGWEDYGYFMNGNNPQIYNHDENDCPMYYKLLCVAPTYMEVWLWLWEEKNIHIEIIGTKINTQCYATINDEKDTILFKSPEEAIIAAIEYLCENDLIK